jgi:hypothetical protein
MAKEEKKDLGEILASWSFNEYAQYQRGKRWYVAAFLIIIFLLFYSLITANFLFAVIVILGAVTILMRDRYGPDKIDFAITEDGLKVEDKFYEYDLFSQFYIIYKPPHIKTLFVDFKSILKPRLSIPLENQNPLKIREVLKEYLKEDLDKEEEPISESLKRILKI